MEEILNAHFKGTKEIYYSVAVKVDSKTMLKLMRVYDKFVSLEKSANRAGTNHHKLACVHWAKLQDLHCRWVRISTGGGAPGRHMHSDCIETLSEIRQHFCSIYHQI